MEVNPEKQGLKPKYRGGIQLPSTGTDACGSESRKTRIETMGQGHTRPLPETLRRVVEVNPEKQGLKQRRAAESH